MRNLVMFSAVAACVFALSACGGNPPKELKSPCVGIEGSPCARHAVNQG